MSWDRERSTERVAKEWKRLKAAGISIKPLTREMDLTNLSPTDARLVHGVHIYCNITNFAEVLHNDLMQRDDFKRLHRYLHVLRVELRRVMQEVFDGDKIQVQGPKFHGLLYKPYDNDESLAINAVLTGVVIYLVHTRAVADVFPDYPDLIPSLGLELGDCVVANIGTRGDRELISVGSAANRPAKFLGADHTLSIGPHLWSALPDKWRKAFTKSGDVYKLDPRRITDPEELVSDAGFNWSIEKSIVEMNKAVESLPLDSIQSSAAKDRINLDMLGPKHFKTCQGSSVFVDIDGYTAFVESLFGDEEKLGEAVQLLHLFRYELRQLSETDCDALVIQHQGDRLQALLQVPADDEKKIRNNAVELCIDFNSSVEEVLNELELPAKLHVAIGADFGDTVVVRSGVRGDLDASCLADATLSAEALQLVSAGKEVRVSDGLFESTEDKAVQGLFVKDKTHNCYVGRNVTWTRVDDANASKAYAAAVPVAFDRSAGGIRFNLSASEENVASKPEYLKQTRPWADEHDSTSNS